MTDANLLMQLNPYIGRGMYDNCSNTIQTIGTLTNTSIDGRLGTYFTPGNYIKVNTNSKFNLTGDFTIEFWLKKDGNNIHIKEITKRNSKIYMMKISY